jgi:hypothetical protein
MTTAPMPALPSAVSRMMLIFAPSAPSTYTPAPAGRSCEPAPVVATVVAVCVPVPAPVISIAVPASALARLVASLKVSVVSTIAKYVVAADNPVGRAPPELLTWTALPVTMPWPTAVQMSVVAAVNTVSAIPCAQRAAAVVVSQYSASPIGFVVSSSEVSVAAVAVTAVETDVCVAITGTMDAKHSMQDACRPTLPHPYLTSGASELRMEGMKHTETVTAETMTVEQLRELRDLAAGAPWIVTDTFIAERVGKSDMFWEPVTEAENLAARERCATIWNALQQTRRSGS